MSPSHDDLQRSWAWLRRPYWPATLEETLEDPIRGRLVRLYASHLARSRSRVMRHAQRRTHQVDVKRAAAGDLED